MPTLVAADADRVQDLIFRSSRLREVTGGSHALEDFWTRAAGSAKAAGARVLVSAGGTFRAVFDDASPDAADAFARDLADAYALEIGGLLTLATIGEGSTDPELLARAAARLRVEKLSGDPPVASLHLPYLQPCDSCGRDLAAERVPVGGGEVQDLCRVCARRRNLRDVFQGEFLTGVGVVAGEAAHTPGGLPEDANEVGEYDGRRRVAYLLADGNGFGRCFGRAAERGMDVYRDLSTCVSTAGRAAITAATAKLVDRIPRPSHGRAPVLPLITGGDDIFALLPAPHAFQFVRDFVAAFVAHVGEAEFFTLERDAVPSVSCALVFCKATFPYRFAHQAGENALKAAKRASRRRPGLSLLRATELRGTVGGGEHGPRDEHGVFRVDGMDGEGRPDVADDGGDVPLPVSGLMDARARLAWLPGKRRHQVEALFAADDRRSEAWRRRLDRVLARSGMSAELDIAFRSLGFDRDTGAPGAVVDLLHLWDYLGPAAPAHRNQEVAR